MVLPSLDRRGVKKELTDTAQALFECPSVAAHEVLDENCEEPFIQAHQKLIMDVLCESRALKVTNNHINKPTPCRLGTMNN